MSVTTAIAANTFCWPELCSADARGSKSFYSSLFGWNAHDMHMPEGDYTVFKLNGDHVAAMYQMAEDRRKVGILPHWNSYVAVANADEAAEKAAILGGKVLMQPFEAGSDRIANLEDSEGVKFCITEIGQQSEPIRLNEIGALSWSELYTNNTDESSTFYSALFGWRAEPWNHGSSPYTMFKLAEDDRAVGGMLPITERMKGIQPQWLPYFRVSDADASAERARTLGGKVCGPLMDIPTVGRMAMIADPQGAGFAIIKTI